MEMVLLVGVGLGAGLLGAMVGVGGGVILVPAMVLGFGVPLEEAIPASLMCVVASSCGAAANYVEHQLSDIRLALTLELATVGGALAGGLVAGFIAPAWIAVVFGVFLAFTALQLFRARAVQVETAEPSEYVPVNYPLGISGSFVAGGLSALLGVGGGPIKVPLMAIGMRVPFKIAAATSNLMIGLTAAASVMGYAARGHLNLGLAAPLVVGVLAGAMTGSRIMVRTPTAFLKRLFSVVLLAVAAQMLWKGGAALWLRP
jgi:hypothetical protein